MTTTLITGANKGIGFGTARLLAEAGHTVYVGARDLERGREAAARIGARAVELDVTDDDSVAAALATVEAAEGHLDVLVNNAAVGDGRPGVDAITGPDALTQFDTNAVGVVRVTQAALPLLRRSGNPVVVNLCSGLGSFWAVTNPERTESHAAFVVYGATKAAVSMLTVLYAKAVPEVKFNAVEPGFTATDFTASFGGGRPVEESARLVARWATIGPDGPTGTFQETGGALAW